MFSRCNMHHPAPEMDPQNNLTTSLVPEASGVRIQDCPAVSYTPKYTSQPCTSIFVRMYCKSLNQVCALVDGCEWLYSICAYLHMIGAKTLSIVGHCPLAHSGQPCRLSLLLQSTISQAYLRLSNTIMFTSICSICIQFVYVT